VAAVLEDGGTVLVNRRPAGKPMAGSLEFPGGKLHPGEGRRAGLDRELHEELGIRVAEARPLIRYLHRYPDFEVDLDVWRVSGWTGEPRGLEGQELIRMRPRELLDAGLLPADRAVVSALVLPDVCAVTPPSPRGDEAQFLDALEDVAARGQAGLVVLRRPGLDVDSLLDLLVGAACRVDGAGARLIVHGDPAVLAPILSSPPEPLRPRLVGAIAGLHVPGRFLQGMQGRPVPAPLLFGVSCHSREELDAAASLGADYAFLGSVKATSSHPGRPGLGWQRFGEMVEGLALPTYAIGGMKPEDLDEAWSAGAQGIAAIGALWGGPA